MEPISGPETKLMSETGEKVSVSCSSPTDQTENLNSTLPCMSKWRTITTTKERPTCCVAAAVFSVGAVLTATFTTVFCATEDILAGTTMSTGVVLVALGGSSLLAKVTSPFLSRTLTQMTRVVLCVVLLSVGLACTLSSKNVSVRIAGVCMVSLGTGVGEVTLYTEIVAQFHEKAQSVFTEGTGVAGLLGGALYVGMDLFVVLFNIAIPHTFQTPSHTIPLRFSKHITVWLKSRVKVLLFICRYLSHKLQTMAEMLQ